MSVVEHGFGRRVKEARDMRGLSQADLISEIRQNFKKPISLRTLKRIETGQYYRYRTKAKNQIARVLSELR